MKTNYNFDNLYKTAFAMSNKDYDLINPEDITNLVYWSDDILYNIFKIKAHNRDVLNFIYSTYYSTNNSTSSPLYIAELYNVIALPRKVLYLGEITKESSNIVSEELKNSKVLQKYFCIHSFLKNYYINNTLSSGLGSSNDDFKYCIYFIFKDEKDLEILTTYSRLVNKKNNFTY